MGSVKAVKVWNKAGDKATVQLIDENGNVIAKAGGNRAARANAVLVIDGCAIDGLRSDAAKAEVEAAGRRRGKDGFKLTVRNNADGTVEESTYAKYRGDRAATVKGRIQRHHDHYGNDKTVVSAEAVSGLWKSDIEAILIEEVSA